MSFLSPTGEVKKVEHIDEGVLIRLDEIGPHKEVVNGNSNVLGKPDIVHHKKLILLEYLENPDIVTKKSCSLNPVNRSWRTLKPVDTSIPLTTLRTQWTTPSPTREST